MVKELSTDKRKVWPFLPIQQAEEKLQTNDQIKENKVEEKYNQGT